MSFADSNAFTIVPAGASMPTYLSAVGDLQWGSVAATATVAAVAPSPLPGGTTGHAAVTTAYSGGMKDTLRKRLCLHGGGHADYFGNEWYAIGMEANAPAWQRLSTPSASFGSGDRMSDGAPRACHTYRHLSYDPASDRYLCTSRPYFSQDGASSRSVDAFNPTTGTWQQRADNLIGDGNGIIHGGGLYDSTLLKHWIIANESFNSTTQFDQATNTHTIKGGGNLLLDMGGGGLEIATNRRILICHKGATFRFLDITNDTTIALGWRLPAATSGTAMNAECPGIMWHQTSGKFVFYNGGQTLRTLTPPANLSSGTWAWGAVPVTGITPAAAAPHNGGDHTWGLAQLLENINGSGRDIIAFCPSVSGPTYFIRMPVAGV